MVKHNPSASAPLTLVDMVDDVNLRHIGWNVKVLESIQRAHKLQHGEAVVFCNKAQDRFRLVASIYGVPVLMLPPTDSEQRLSLYLKVNTFLAKLRPSPSLQAHLVELDDHARDRLAKRQALAVEAQEHRTKKGVK